MERIWAIRRRDILDVYVDAITIAASPWYEKLACVSRESIGVFGDRLLSQDEYLCGTVAISIRSIISHEDLSVFNTRSFILRMRFFFEDEPAPVLHTKSALIFPPQRVRSPRVNMKGAVK